MRLMGAFYTWLMITAVLLVLAPASAARAQLGVAGPKVECKAVTETDAAHPGSELRVALTFKLDAGWHVNSNKPLDEFAIPTEFTVSETPGFSATKVVYPKHKVIRLAFSPDPLAVYEETFAIGLVLKVADTVEPKAYTVKGQLRYQACNDKQCVPPKNMDVEFPVKVVPKDQAVTPQAPDVFKAIPWEGDTEKKVEPGKKSGAMAATGAASDDWRALADQFREIGRLSGYATAREFLAFLDKAEKGEGSNTNALANKSAWVVLALVLGGGLLLNLTPCVLPLIPINIAIIGAGARAGSRTRGFALGGAYGAGIALVYGLLGLVVVLGISSAFGSINSTVWFNAAIAVLFLLLGLAMFEVINIDFSKYQAKIGLWKNERGSFVIAFVMGAISALLAGACVAPVVIYTIVYAQNQYAKGVSAALALPFLLGVGMALPWPFAGAGLSFLPQPGAWMTRVKQAFGVFIIAFALYYGHLAYGLFSDRYLVDRKAVEASATEEGGWLMSFEAGLEQAQAEKKTVLLDFWATWCKNCLVMNKTTLKDAAVQDRLKNFVKIKYQAEDPGSPPVKGVWDYYGLLGLPTYVVLQPKAAT